MPLNADRVRVGPFELDVRAAELIRDGVKVRLQEQPLRVLVALIEHAGEVVTRDELRRRLWPADTFVDFERSLNAAVKRLREALGESADTPHYIETLPRHGYRLIVPVEPLPSAHVDPASSTVTQSGAEAGPPPPRARRPRWMAAGLVAGLVVLGGASGAWWWTRDGRAATAPNAARQPGKVVVAAFANATGDASLDALGLEIGHWLTQSLSRIGADVAINPELPSLGSLELARPAGDASDPNRSLAARTGAGLVVSGAYYLDGDRIRVQSQVIDGATGGIVVTLDPGVGPRARPGDVVGVVANVVMGWMAVRLNRPVATGLGGVRPPTYEAFVEYYQYMRSADHSEDSISRLRRCLQLDPGFVMARVSLWGILVTIGRHAEADEILRPAEQPDMYGQATKVDQAYIRFMRALLDGSWDGQLTAARELTQMEPTSRRFSTLGNTERRAHRPHAALDALARVRPEDSPAELRLGGALWRRSQLHHELEQFDQELELARLGQRLYPASGIFYSAEGGALIALGRLTEIDEVLTRAGKAPLRDGELGAVLFHAARELTVHGYPDAARSMAVRAADWYVDRIAQVEPSAALRARCADALIQAGRCQQGLPLRRALMREEPDDLSHRSNYATALVRCGGSRDEALRIAEALGRSDPPYAHGYQLYLQARVLAALGDGEGAVRALEASFVRGYGFDNPEMHLNYAWHPIRGYPPFQEWLKPRD